MIRWLCSYTRSENIFLELPSIPLNWRDENYQTLSEFYEKSFSLDLISFENNLMIFGWLEEE